MTDDELDAIRERARDITLKWSVLHAQSDRDRLLQEVERLREVETRWLGYQSAPVHVAETVLKGRLRETARVLIEVLGADGPMDAEDAARKAAEEIRGLRENLALDRVPVNAIHADCPSCGEKLDVIPAPGTTVGAADG